MRTQLNRRNRTACSILALATALAVGPSPAAAQSFLGTGSPLVAGSATITTPNGTTTNVAVNNPQTVITWSPSDTATSTSPIIFQPGGTTTNFVMGGSNYAVLNKIIATDQTRQIQFFGTVNSNIGSTTGPVGGSIYFYAPGGFLLGGGSVFNVGSLVLSASPILHDANGTFITGARNEVTFGQATQLGATITTNTGSQINALGNPGANSFSNSYVAFVAPRIIRGGDIAVDGQAAMVAAEAATIRFAPDGLFDVEVTSGTGQANGITGGGDITGPASSGAGDNHRVYMVAVPKNQALSLALSQGSDLGFNIANAADVVGNAIVLSAGHDIVNGQIQSAPSAGGGTGAASISANAVYATSAVTAQATGFASFFSNAGQASNFASNLTVTAPEYAWASASGSDSSFNVVGDITLNSDVFGSVEGASATGGWASLYAQNGGFVSIGGNATLSANGFGAGSSGDGVSAGSGTGGRAWIQAEPGSSMFITGAASATADGYGGQAFGANASGGAGIGGQALIRAFGASSSLGIDGNATASAYGYGGYAGNGNGGLGQGGEAAIYADSGAVTVDGNALAITSGFGGSGGGAGNVSGNGLGGDSYVYANAGGSLNVAGQLTVASHASGGIDFDNLAASGDGEGGNATLYAFGGGDVTVGGFTSVQANGNGGSGGECISCGGAAGVGRGGNAEISSSGVGSTLVLATTSVAAHGLGSDGVVGVGGDGFGGYAELWAQGGGSVAITGGLTVGASGFGGSDFGGFGGGDGFGGGYLGDGYAQLATYGTHGATSISVTGATQVSAQGFGGHALEAAGASGGDGRGGIASITANIGSISLNSVTVAAVGDGGDTNAGTGGNGTGGDAYVYAAGGNVAVANSAAVSAAGLGGEGAIGGSGTGGGDVLGQFGGAALYASGNGVLTIGGQATVTAHAIGRSGATAGGAANGGVAQVNAFSGGDIDLLGLTRVTTDATAGSGADGRGGVSIARAGSGSTIDFNTLNLRADGTGGSQIGGDVGDGYGGTAILEASGTGAIITLANTLTGTLQDSETLSADGFGGATALSGGTGGTGIGGTVHLRSTAGGVVTLAASAGASNPLYFRARGYGGDPNAEGATGGLGDGGTLNLVVDGGTMTLGTSQYSSIGEGGFTTFTGLNTNGGDGLGGERHITVLNGGTLTAAFPGGVSGGVGGFATGTGNGGNGSGGLATLTVDNSTLNITGNTIITSQVSGGPAESGNGGNALGGNNTFVSITNGSTVNIASGATLGISANSFGGGATAGSGNGGNAIGGTTTVNITGSSILGGTMTAGSGGSGGSSVGGTGGNGTAGTAVVNLNGATINGMAFSMGSNGFGGSGLNGGNGIGGTAVLNSFGAASSVTTTGLISIQAGGLGASSTGSGNGGNGTAAGAARIFANGGTTLTLNGNVEVDASASGGAGGANGGNGGAADGGMAEIYVNGATININGNATLSADAVGGNSPVGTGGNAFGGTARIGTDAGLLTISGTLGLDGSALGGNGTIGGNAVAIGDPLVDDNTPMAASIYAGNNGAVIVGGATAINVSATGGNGSNGNGGNATAGETDIVAYIGDITLAALTLNANGTGGNGGLGGNGGVGNGGFVDVAFGLGSAPVDGVTTIADATITANGIGGAGGAGTDANTGGNGGAGGAGNGGGITFAGSAAGGSLQGGNITLSATATGGAGGAGGNGDSGTGGNGGAGGAAIGGYIQTGTISNQNSPGSGGDFDVGNLAINTSAFGGNGGNGGNGGAGNGAGGNGGNAEGGRSDFLIRGVAGSADAVILQASATGGNGGTGSTVGNGGNAVTGVMSAESKDRFGHPTQRGSLVADSITATAIATGGSGATPGTETISGGSTFRILNGDADIGSVSFTISGDIYAPTPNTFDYVSVRDGTANIGDFSFVTSGELTLDASNGIMNADSLTLSAGTFVANPAALGAPSAIGSYQADFLSITTGGDFITNANLSILNDVLINAPGEIQAVGIGSGLGDVTLLSADGITAGNVVAGGDLTAQTTGAMALGNIGAGSSLLAESTGALTLLNVTAGLDIELNSATSLSALDVSSSSGGILSRVSGQASFGGLSAGQGINLGATGALAFTGAIAGETVRLGSDVSISGGAVTAGDSIVATSGGAIALGNLSAGIVNPAVEGLYEVALVTAGTISTGTINAAGDVQLAATGGITTDDVTTTERMFAVSPGAIALGDVTTGGYLLIGGTGLFAFTGSLLIDGGGFDARPTFANSGGPGAASVTTGALNVGSLEIGAAGNVATLGITADLNANIQAGGNFSFGNVSADDFDFEVGGTVQGGNIVATSHAGGEAEGAIVLGDITVSGPPPVGDFSVGFSSATSIQVGNVNGFDTVGFATLGNLTTGSINAGSLIMTLVSGDIVTGALTTASNGQVYIADSSMYATGGGPDDFDETIVLAMAPVATGGSLDVNGAIDTPLFRAAIGDAFAIGDISVEGGFAVTASSITTGDITATAFIDLAATGALVTGDLFAGTSVTLSGASVMTGNIVAGQGQPVVLQGFTTMDVGPGNSVEIFSDSSIVTGNITTDGYVGLYAADDITAGSITAEHDVIALAGGDASFGPITTPERFILAGYSNFDQLNDGETFDPELIFQIFPIAATGGNALFSGSSQASEFHVYAGGNVTLASVAAQGEFGGFLDVEAGGLLSINGTVSGDYVRLLSSDIAIGQLANVNASSGVSFISINSTGTYIGDNLGGQGGYRLSQAELDRVNTNALEFEVDVARGGAPIMYLGDLEFDIQESGDEDVVEFGIEDDGEEETATGIIRVVGNVNFVLDADKGVEFSSDTFEIDAATGSVSLVDSSGALTGTLDIEARNIFIASADILAKLEQNPQYAGFREELNAPAAVQRPEGVVRAALITLNEDGSALENILIQNTGTSATPAGFLINELTLTGDSDGEGDEAPAPGSINMVINGQVETESGTLTGSDVRDAFVEEFGTEIFVEGSTINGCDLSGNCGGSTDPVPPTAVVTPTQVAILTSDPLGESVFGNEGDIAGDSSEGSEGGEDGSASSPIDAPQPLFDTRPLNSDEDVNEPVSGAGNPSLYGISSDEDDAGDEEDEEEKKKKKNKGEVQPAAQPNARTGDGQ